MILFAKHLALMSVMLLIVPILARVLARAIGKRHRLNRPGVSFLIVLAHLGIALLVPLFAQGAYEFLGVRWLSLGLAGAIYGGLFGDEQDFPLGASLIWGFVGGLGAAYCFRAFPPSSEARSLCVAVFAVAPLLAYRPVSQVARRRVASGGVINPTRRILR